MPDEPPAPAAPLSAVAILFVGDDDGEHNVPSEHRYRTTWRVAMESDLATAFDVLAATSPLPQPGESFRRYDWNDTAWVPGEVLDYYAVVVLRSARRDPENPYWWLVAVSYEGSTDPTAEPAEVDYQDGPFQEFVSQDIHGAAVANTALDPFDGGMPVDRGRMSLVIVRNVPYDGWNPEIAKRYRHTLNEAPYRHGALVDEYDFPLEAAPGTAKITSLTARRVIRSKAATALSARYYWQVRAQIEFDDAEFVLPSGATELCRWRWVVLDAGYRKIVDGVRTQIFTTGMKPTHPPLLDGKGLPLPSPPTSGTIPLPDPVPNEMIAAPQNGTYYVGGSELSVPIPGLMALAPGASAVEFNSGFAPTKGSVVINSDGSFVYTPAPGESGWDAFGVNAYSPLPDSTALFYVRVLIGPRPVYLAFDRYYPADWSDIAQWVGDW